MTADEFHEAKLAKALQQALCATLEITFGIQTQPGDLRECHVESLPRDSIACALDIQRSGKRDGSLLFFFSQTFISELLERLGSPHDVAFAMDTAEEIVNMVFGVMKANLNAEGNNLEAVFPKALKDSKEALAHCQTAACLSLPFHAGKHECEVMISLSHR